MRSGFSAPRRRRPLEKGNPAVAVCNDAWEQFCNTRDGPGLLSTPSQGLPATIGLVSHYFNSGSSTCLVHHEQSRVKIVSMCQRPMLRIVCTICASAAARGGVLATNPADCVVRTADIFSFAGIRDSRIAANARSDILKSVCDCPCARHRVAAEPTACDQPSRRARTVLTSVRASNGLARKFTPSSSGKSLLASSAL
jgi:hypothetical protein